MSTFSRDNVAPSCVHNIRGVLLVNGVLCPEEMKDLHHKMFPFQKKSRSRKKVVVDEPLSTPNVPVDTTSITRGQYDLCSYISKGWKKGPEKFDQYNFCPLVYSIEGGFDGDGYKELSRTLIRAAESSTRAFSIAGNGTLSPRKDCKNAKEWKCSCGRTTRCKMAKEGGLDNVEFRKHSIMNDKKNSRGLEGQRGPVKFQGRRMKPGQSTCKFSFSVRINEKFGCFSVYYTGNPFHNHLMIRPSELPAHDRTLDPEDRRSVRDTLQAGACLTVGQSLYGVRTSGKLIRRQAIKCIKDSIPFIKKSLQDSGEDIEDSDFSTVDKLIGTFKSRGYSYCMLKQQLGDARSFLLNEMLDSDPFQDESDNSLPTVNDKPDDESTIATTDGIDFSELDTNMGLGEIIIEPLEDESNAPNVASIDDSTSTTSSTSGSSTTSSLPELRWVDLPDLEFSDMEVYAEDSRKTQFIDDDQDLMVAIAWMLPEEKRLWRLYGRVVQIDATVHTTKEDRPLLTLTGRTALGKAFIILRVYLPNERGWAYRWLFNVAFPLILGSDYRLDIAFITTDGDNQAIKALDAAILKFFPNCYRNRCGWHIVDRGWNAHCPGKTLMPQGIANLCKTWLYTWMKPVYCETEDEYKLSKSLLSQYLHSDFVVTNVSETHRNMVETFIRGNVEVVESRYCFYLRKMIRHFDQYTNCSQEAVHRGMKGKNVGLKVTPQMALHTSAQQLSTMAERSVAWFNLKSAEEAHQRKFWTNSPTSDALVTLGESLVLQEWSAREDYVSIRIESRKWLVIREQHLDDDYRKKIQSPIPKFVHVRIISASENGILNCSCCMFERVGIVCRHCMHVMSKNEPNMKGVQPDDISVHWHSFYAYYAFRTDLKDDDVQQRLVEYWSKRAKYDSEGPMMSLASITDEINAVTPSFGRYYLKPAGCRCLNYSKEKLRLMRICDDSGNLTCNTPSFGMTQESNVDDSELGLFEGFDMLEDDYEFSDFYAALVPRAKDISNILEQAVKLSPTLSALAEEKLKYLSGELRKVENEMRTEITKVLPNHRRGKLVSSNLPMSKKKKPAGIRNMVGGSKTKRRKKC